MSYKEKNTVFSIVGAIIITIIYGVLVFQKYQLLSLNTTNDLRFWGIAFLILLPVIIVPQLFIHFVFMLVNSIKTKEKPPTFNDELDKLIDLKIYRNGFIVLVFGLFASMSLLIFNLSPRVVFISLIISTVLSSIIGDLTKLYFYRRGF